jgi:prepilin-type N-terminal cleavage/methylation domain-containing protein
MFEFRSSSSNKYWFTKSLFRSKSAFTLVELIVVITILAILALVAFLMMSDATVSARDSNRLASIKNIYDASQLQAVQQRLLPLPDQAITLTVSGTDIGWQWYMSGYVAQAYGYSDSVYDPRDNTPYIYRVNQTRNKSQYLAYLENGWEVTQGDILLALGWFGWFGIDTAQATDFSKRVPYVYGDRLGVVLSNTTNEGANVALWSGGTLDLGGNTIDSNYSVYVNEWLKLASVEWTGAVALKTNGGLDQVIAGGSVVGGSGSGGVGSIPE